ncbi:MAG: hypothetical protein IKZ35_02235 [Clostridia bacterium]|nr:hypothetical protein [Clostridia bacterium]
MNKLHNIILIILSLVGIIFFVINERKNIKEWLLYAVIEAEKNLGSKMGQLKLRQVYDEFIYAFPFVSKILPFSLFSKMIDNALVEMKAQIEKNVKLKEYVNS